MCGVLSARGTGGVELYFSANFAQLTLAPPRIAINPNRLYPIEPAIRSTRRFAINVMPVERRDEVIRLMNIRRRQPRKMELLRMQVLEDQHGIPFLDEALRTIFCEVETVHNTGDHTLIIGRVLESRVHRATSGRRPLLFGEVTRASFRFSSLYHLARTLMLKAGVLDQAKRFYAAVRPPPPTDLPRTTFDLGGHTEGELHATLQFGLLDDGRRLRPATAPAVITGRVGVCVIGVGSWGSYHCHLVRRAHRSARLFVCGRNPERTARVARAVGAEDFFVEMEQAVGDPRIQAYTVALPHDLHRPAVELLTAAGKHALVEKPIACTLHDADAMIEAATRAGTILMVAEDMHFRPAIREALARIEQGDLGEPLYLLAHAGGVLRPKGWKAEKERSGGGVLMDIGVHYIRALRLLLGEPHTVAASRAMQVNTKMSGEDSVQLTFSSPVGWEAHMLLSWASYRGHLPDIVIVGDKGTVHLWPGTAYIDYYPVAPRSITKLISYVRPYWLQSRLRHPAQQRQRITLAEREGAGYVAEFREFLSAVTAQRPPVTGPKDARRDVEIVLCGYDALARGGRVDIRPL